MAAVYRAIGIAIGLASTVIDKPALHPNLEYCNQGLMDNLPAVQSNQRVWQTGSLPRDCSKIASDADRLPADMEAYTISYTDCEDPWILCRHKDAPYSINELVDFFGRVPVGTRQWVRHLVHLPDTSGHAYNSNGNIALFGTVTSPLNVLVHESGHSLDLLGAYAPIKPLSSSQVWLDNYHQDSYVPDRYARTNQVENVAQNTVIAMFDQNVPGGFATIEPGWEGIHHQYSTVQDQADKAGNLLKPGGTCTHRLDNSPSQQVGNSTTTTTSRVRRYVPVPAFSRSPHIKVIESRSFDTRELGCKLAHRNAGSDLEGPV